MGETAMRLRSVMPLRARGVKSLGVMFKILYGRRLPSDRLYRKLNDPLAVMPFFDDRYRMELRHLRAFQAVAEELNFCRAARKLHVAQPALSRTIADLEAEMEVRL